MKRIFLVVLLFVFSGCATKNYGRQSLLTGFEKSQLSCREIDIEISKTIGFINDIEAESKFSGRRVLSFFGDFGIGNVVEKNAALDSAHKRLNDLQNLKAEKGCSIDIKENLKR